MQNTVEIKGLVTPNIIEETMCKIQEISQSEREISILFDSPGGHIVGLPKLVDLLFSLRKTHSTKAFVEGHCCSAAYWIASACTEIVASKESVLGSVGVVAEYIDDSQALEKQGFFRKIFRSKQNPLKNLDPSSPEGAEELQKILDHNASIMQESILKNRPSMDKKALLGGVFSSKEALEKAMIDSIGYYNNPKKGETMTQEQENKIFAKLDYLAESKEKELERITALEASQAVLTERLEALSVENKALHEKLFTKLEAPQKEQVAKFESFFGAGA